MQQPGTATSPSRPAAARRLAARVAAPFLLLMGAACQNNTPPIYLNEAQQRELDVVLTRVSLEVLSQRAQGVALSTEHITDILRREDPAVQAILAPGDWPTYQATGRDFLATQIYRRLLKRQRRTASEVAAEAPVGFRSPAVGGHH